MLTYCKLSVVGRKGKKERARQYQNDRAEAHGEAYQNTLHKRREWYALNSEQIKEKQRQRYHEKHDPDIKKKAGRKAKASINIDNNPSSSSPDTSDLEQ